MSKCSESGRGWGGDTYCRSGARHHYSFTYMYLNNGRACSRYEYFFIFFSLPIISFSSETSIYTIQSLFFGCKGLKMHSANTNVDCLITSLEGGGETESVSILPFQIYY